MRIALVVATAVFGLAFAVHAAPLFSPQTAPACHAPACHALAG